MSWFGTTTYPDFEEKIEKATSESIPNGDIDFATALEVSDLIRSKQVPAKEAMRGLKKRFMDADNINQQKSLFKLIDFCIKNGGEHFILEISSKEFMDPLVIKLKNSDTNDSLKEYILENIQTWSIMVSTNPKFDYINQTYRKLQSDGFEFPAIRDFVDPNLIESKVAPEWDDSDACMICSKLFTFLNRKHHCRSCGGVFCSLHSSKSIDLPELGINIPVRVCDNCYADHKAKRKKQRKSKRESDAKSSVSHDDDDELQKAIALSLQATATKNSATAPASRSNDGSVLQPTQDDEEDEEMKAAIQASLAEIRGKSESANIENVKEPQTEEPATGLYANLMEDKPYEVPVMETPVYVQPQPQAQVQPQFTVEQRGQYASQPTHQPPQHSSQQTTSMQVQSRVPPHTLNGSDEQEVIQFIEALEQSKSNPGAYNSDIIRLHSDVILLHPKVADALNKEQMEINKYQSLYSKLFVISRLYDDILQTRFQKEQEMLKAQTTRFQQLYAPNQSYAAPPPLPRMDNSLTPSYTPQSQIQSQPTFNAYTPRPYYTQGPVPEQMQQQPEHSQYLSPQMTYGHAPQVFQLQKTGTGHGHAHPAFTSQQTIQQPQFAPVESVPEPALSRPPAASSVEQPGDTTNPLLASLDRLQYVPIPAAEQAEQAEPTLAPAESAPEPTKEPEVVNLIDL